MGGFLGQNGRLSRTKWAANSQAETLLTGSSRTKWAANSQAETPLTGSSRTKWAANSQALSSHLYRT